MAEPAASREGLMAEAAARAGSHDWGDLGFTGPLDLLLDSCRESAALTPAGWQVLHSVVRRHLANRLALQQLLGAGAPATAVQVAPLVITGLPRTGTTVLHQLLAQDDQHQVLRLWEALGPAAAAAAGAAERQALVERAESWLTRFRTLAPAVAAIHPLAAEGPEECDVLLQNSFASQHFDDMFDAERYSGWYATSGLLPEYRYYACQLAALCTPLAGSGGSARTWVLKSPSHLGHLDALLDVLPGAVVVHCHRHPAQAVASYASLIRAVRAPHTEQMDLVRVGTQALHRCSLALQRALLTRDRAPDRFIDVAYDELVAEPLAVVRSLYERLGWSCSPAAQTAMARWLADNPQHRQGQHRYGLAEFGLHADQVAESFGDYLDRFGGLGGQV